MAGSRIPFFPMDEFVDQAVANAGLTLDDLDKEVIRGLTLGYDHVAKAPPYNQDWFIRDQVEYEGLSPWQAYQCLSTNEREFFDGLPHEQKQRYLFFSGANFMWDWGLMLTQESSWEKRHGPKTLWPQARQGFPSLLRFIRFLPFEYTGRIFIMGTSPRQKVYRHTDSRKEEELIDCVITTFQPSFREKKAFVEDDQGNTYAPPVRGYCLDDSFPHYLEAKPYFTYSVRVEGKLRRGIRESMEPRYVEYLVSKSGPTAANTRTARDTLQNPPSR